MHERTGRVIRVVTFGTFDLFHIGHLRILERARALGDHLSVGVSSDALNMAKKGRVPIFPQAARTEIIAALRCVNHVFIEESLEFKRRYLTDLRADILVMGHDWAGRFDEFRDCCRVVYLDRTPDISTTSLNELIRGG